MQNKDTIFKNIHFHVYVIQSEWQVGNNITMLQATLKNVLPFFSTKWMGWPEYHSCSNIKVLGNYQGLWDLPKDTYIKVKDIDVQGGSSIVLLEESFSIRQRPAEKKYINSEAELR